MAALRIHEVDVERRGQIFPKPHRFTIKRDPLWSDVIRTNDCGIAGRVAATDIALFQHGYICNRVLFGQIVRACQAVAAAADDHDIVVGSKGIWGFRQNS